MQAAESTSREGSVRGQLEAPHMTGAAEMRDAARERLTVRSLNGFFTCSLCRGYMINPTTVDNCYHSYCRSCIVRHLYSNPFCPECKSTENGPVDQSLLRSDEALRALIYKTVPGLYQKERERATGYAAALRNGQAKLESYAKDGKEPDAEEEFFSPTEPISLSLEYHPLLLANCSTEHVPAVRYLQCPASVRILHLKRFLCSKYSIDPANKRIDVEVIYEDEVLPDDFTLMDVGYCYNWKRHAPMQFTYRILFLGGEPPASDSPQTPNTSYPKDYSNAANCVEVARKPMPPLLAFKATKTVSFSDDVGPATAEPSEKPRPKKTQAAGTKSKPSRHSRVTDAKNGPALHATALERETKAPVKVVIARKAAEPKKQSPKRSDRPEDTVYTVTSDFKSLRSNDMRYCDYSVTSTTTTPTITPTTTPTSGATGRSDSERDRQDKKEKEKEQEQEREKTAAPKCDIVVSIPRATAQSSDELFENMSLAQLKTANKKSPPTSAAPAGESHLNAKKARNVPKLKIELSSLKATLSGLQPKSADARLEETHAKRPKHRKHSLDDSAPAAYDRVDIKTYAKHIGLKPIEVYTPTSETLEAHEKPKYSPSASPMSSSSSTTSSSNGNGPLAASCETLSPSTSFHKKRKKKHSKDSKDSNSKRRKLHAEISSQPADESLKMKVKITASHNHRPHKLDSRKSSGQAAAISHTAEPDGGPRVALTALSNDISSLHSMHKPPKELAAAVPPLTLVAAGAERVVEPPKTGAAETAASAGEQGEKPVAVGLSGLPAQTTLVAKPVAAVKETKIPSSPPLPPSLFKTTALPFANLSIVPAMSSLTPKPPATAPTAKSKPIELAAEKIVGSALPTLPTLPTLAATAKPAVAPPEKCGSANAPSLFAIPNLPRQAPSSQKFLSTPSSIACAFNKQLGTQPKRSASLDDASGALTKQQRYDQDRLVRKTAYGPFCGSTQMGSAKFVTTRPRPGLGSMSGSGAGPGPGSAHDDKAAGSLMGNAFELPPYATLAGAYTSEYGKRKVTPSSISICKVSDATLHTSVPSSTSAVTITTRPRPTSTYPQLNLLPYNLQHVSSKPALEIVRITSSQLPPEMVSLHSASPPKGQRLMGPPVSIVKTKKLPTSPSMSRLTSSPAGSVVRSPPLVGLAHASTTGKGAGSTYCTSPPALINLSSNVPHMLGPKAADARAKALLEGVGKANSAVERAKPGLREFRPCLKDGVDILDLSSAKSQAASSTEPSAAQRPMGNSLEAALNKIKQNISSVTNVDSASAAKKAVGTGTGTSTSMSAGTSTALVTVTSASAVDASPEDLQNLHLLSESATAREKIAIKAQQFEKPKLQQLSLVMRQQNASVRNIPNPSALAFRNHPLLPAPLASESVPSSASSSALSPPPLAHTPPPTTTPLTLQAVPVSAPNSMLFSVSQPTTAPGNAPSTAPASAPLTSSSTTTTTSHTLAQTRCTKKATSIDQVAATLNIRAAEASAKAALHDDCATATVTSTTTTSSATSPSVAVDADSKLKMSTEAPAASFAALVTTKTSSTSPVTSIPSPSPSPSTSVPTLVPTSLPAPTPTPTPTPASPSIAASMSVSVTTTASAGSSTPPTLVECSASLSAAEGTDKANGNASAAPEPQPSMPGSSKANNAALTLALASESPSTITA